MKRILDGLPWPERTKPSLAFGASAETGYVVLLHEPLCRGHADVARIAGPTPEGSFRLALEAWIIEKKLNDQPIFFDALRRLVN